MTDSIEATIDEQNDVDADVELASGTAVDSQQQNHPKETSRRSAPPTISDENDNSNSGCESRAEPSELNATEPDQDSNANANVNKKNNEDHNNNNNDNNNNQEEDRQGIYNDDDLSDLMEPVKAEPLEDSTARLMEDDSEYMNMPVVAISSSFYDEDDDEFRGDSLPAFDLSAMNNINSSAQVTGSSPHQREMQTSKCSIRSLDAAFAPSATALDAVSSSTRSHAVRVDVEAHLVRTASDLMSVGHFGDDDEDLASESPLRTAQFISARVIRKNPTDDLGFRIRLHQETNSLVISQVKQDGLLARSPILNGDKILSINNKSCLGMKYQGVLKLLENAKDHVTITVQNERGDGSLVECYVEKPDPKSKIGMELHDHASHRHSVLRAGRGRPVISTINPKGLLEDSLLNPGHTIISVNGKNVWNTRSVIKVLSKAKTHITILAKTSDGGSAAVVTTEPELGTRSRQYDLYGIPTRARRLRLRRRPGRSGESIDSGTSTYDSVRIGCNVTAVVLAIFVILSPARDSLYITSKNWIFAIITIFGLVNAPWVCRRPGSRFSALQLFCNLLILGLFLYQLFGSGEEIQVGWLCALYVPLLIMINLPSLFPDEDDVFDDDLVNDGGGI